MWPGFGDNIRVLDWIIRRCAGEDIAETSAIGFVPKTGTIFVSKIALISLVINFKSIRIGSINTEGLKESVDWRQLFHISKDFWESEALNVEKYFLEQMSDDVPPEMINEIKELRQRLSKMT